MREKKAESEVKQHTDRTKEKTDRKIKQEISKIIQQTER
jgi:hypothetical protein